MTCEPFTLSVPRRDDGCALGSTRYESDALPCPDVAVVSATHDTEDDADHVQSRVVEIASCPVEPFAGAVMVVLSTETWHLGASGAVTETAVDPHAAHNSATTHVNTALSG